jgi:uracil phosphoribosyltransferase
LEFGKVGAWSLNQQSGAEAAQPNKRSIASFAFLFFLALSLTFLAILEPRNDMRKLFLLLFIAAACQVQAQSQAISQLVYQLRDPRTDAPHFREALEKIGEYLAAELLSELHCSEVTIETLTGGRAVHRLVDEQPVLVTILRAGLPLTYGVQKVFPYANVGFLAMSRNEETFKADVEYVALPELKNQCVVVVDTMLATGGSLMNALKMIEARKPAKVCVICAFAAQEGIAEVLRQYPNVKIFPGVVDPLLNEKKYIVPGLGDAGDRSFGLKARRG